mmetsp:Transcript_20914/g.55377  ORF Transcript_20914/g.55377 Transcript_20914/m.55377 type:complete len:185 (-) Transcript_20914:77-631(-)
MGRARYAAAISTVAVAFLAHYVPQQLQPPAGVETWLFFDGVCNLCDGFVNFVHWGDSAANVRFGALQKHAELLQSLGAGQYAEGGAEGLTTVVVIQGKDVHVRSSAALRVLAVMDQPWRTLSMFHVIPTPLRDAAYRLVGRNRYALFGQKPKCMVPTGDFKRRFLEYDPSEDADSKDFRFQKKR